MKKANLKIRLSWQDLHVIKNKGEKKWPGNEISITLTQGVSRIRHRIRPGMKPKRGIYPQVFTADVKFDIVGAR